MRLIGFFSSFLAAWTLGACGKSEPLPGDDGGGGPSGSGAGSGAAGGTGPGAGGGGGQPEPPPAGCERFALEASGTGTCEGCSLACDCPSPDFDKSVAACTPDGCIVAADCAVVCAEPLENALECKDTYAVDGKRSLGSACTDDPGCLSGHCYGPSEKQVCVEGELGGPCAEDADCESGVCSAGACDTWRAAAFRELPGASGGAEVATDPSDNVVWTGRFDGTLDVGGVKLSAPGSGRFLAKLAPDGKALWAKAFEAKELGGHVAVAADGGVLLAGGFEGTLSLGGSPLTSVDGDDVYVAYFGPDGAHLWSKAFGAPGSEYVTHVAIDASGDLVVAGRTDGGLDLGGGVSAAPGDDLFVTKMTKLGAHVWTRFFQGPEDVYGFTAMGLGPEGDVFLATYSAQALDLGAGPASGGLLARLRPDGSTAWAKPLPDQEVALSLAAGPAGDVVVSGKMSSLVVDFGGGPIDRKGEPMIFLAKRSKAGEHVWARGLPGEGTLFDTFLAAGQDGRVALVAKYRERVDFGGGFVPTKEPSELVFMGLGFAFFSPEGEPLRSAGFEIGEVYVEDVALSAKGALMATGMYHRDARIDGKTYSSSGNRTFLLTMEP